MDSKRWEEWEKGELLNYERRPTGRLNARDRELQKASVYWRSDSRAANLLLEPLSSHIYQGLGSFGTTLTV